MQNLERDTERGQVVCVFTFYSSNIFDQLIVMTFTARVAVCNVFNNLYYSGFMFLFELARSWFIYNVEYYLSNGNTRFRAVGVDT